MARQGRRYRHLTKPPAAPRGVLALVIVVLVVQGVYLLRDRIPFLADKPTLLMTDEILEQAENQQTETKPPVKTSIPLETVSPTVPALELPTPTVLQEEEVPTLSHKGAQGKLHINLATQAELEELPGIGPATAKRIIAYREENGPFLTLETLKKIKGIGNVLYKELQSYLTADYE